jgi:flavin-dependent dehydrogenase
MNNFDVVVIGAGPSGAVAATKLHKEGYTVLVLEKSVFPRFVIGESLLPQAMNFLQELDLLKSVEKKQFKVKTGASFFHNNALCNFEFSEQYTDGYSYTYQVKRADFDHTLIKEAEKRGVQVRYNCKVIACSEKNEKELIRYIDGGEQKEVSCRFVVDASGYGRVLPNLFNLNKEVDLLPRGAIFSHFTDPNKPKGASDNIFIHAFNNNTAWVWSIPFSDETASVGIVGEVDFIKKCATDDGAYFLEIIKTFPFLKERFADSEPTRKIQSTMNYSKGVSTLFGKNFVLCGNATEFLDPIFSSGVTLAISSGHRAAELISRSLKGETIDWKKDYEDDMLYGIDVFKSYVKAWYNGDLQKIFFSKEINQDYKEQICSVLAGYVWDKSNPFVKKHKTILSTLAKVLSIQNPYT